MRPLIGSEEDSTNTVQVSRVFESCESGTGRVSFEARTGTVRVRFQSGSEHELVQTLEVLFPRASRWSFDGGVTIYRTLRPFVTLRSVVPREGFFNA